MLYFIDFTNDKHVINDSDWTTCKFTDQIYHRLENNEREFAKQNKLEVGDFVFDDSSEWVFLR